MKNHRTLFFFLSAIFLTFALVLILLLMPDMSSTVIDTVPEYPPSSGPIINADSEVLNAVSVDKTNAKSIIAAISRPEEYFSETKSTLSHQKGSAEYIRKKWVKGEISRVDIMSSPTSQSVSMHYIYSSDYVYVWRPNDRNYYRASRGEFDADDTQMMMSYEDIVNADDENIITAQNTMYDGSLCIYVEVRDPDNDYTERYWVATSTGLLVHGQTLDRDGNVIYSISSTQTDISAQDISIFTLPDGSTPDL